MNECKSSSELEQVGWTHGQRMLQVSKRQSGFPARSGPARALSCQQWMEEILYSSRVLDVKPIEGPRFHCILLVALAGPRAPK